MNKIGSVQDLIDILEYVQREWGNDSPIKMMLEEKYALHSTGRYRGKEYNYLHGSALFVGYSKDGTITISNFSPEEQK